MAGCGCSCSPPPPDGTGLRRILWIALIINAVMFGVEGVGGYLAQSVSVQADGLDFLGDAMNYGVSLAVLSLSLRVRALSALAKGATMGAFGLFVIARTAWFLWTGSLPDAPLMGGIGLAALAANLSVALMVFRLRTGDSNLRSVWICSRNDALSNIAVILAATGVFASGAAWPDLAVAALMAGLSLQGAWSVIAHARRDLTNAQLTAGARQEKAPPQAVRKATTGSI
ncbi:MAG: cation transporter [Rhodospirillum sp.]|nr:cation transporter [Rhodospirillum sp.]MCF8490409.1 cation transporter [Rhodospirillum sp.]MCF8500318.1 cation transporter [Rhodospirillum sp.]